MRAYVYIRIYTFYEPVLYVLRLLRLEHIQKRRFRLYYTQITSKYLAYVYPQNIAICGVYIEDTAVPVYDH